MENMTHHDTQRCPESTSRRSRAIAADDTQSMTPGEQPGSCTQQLRQLARVLARIAAAEHVAVTD